MPALIGYLVTLAVFLGGGYAGMQWLTAPEDLPSAVAVHRSVEPVKSTRARVLARKRHEAAAEREANARSMVTTPPAQHDTAPLTVETAAENVAAKPAKVSELAQRNETIQSASLADKPHAEAPSAAKAAAIVGGKATVAASVQPDTPLDSRLSATAGMPASSAVPPPSPQLAKSKPVESSAARPVFARDDEATDSRRNATKRRATTRLASRKPVLMILRTIEFPDGRREQRLLPMPRYRQAFAED